MSGSRVLFAAAAVVALAVAAQAQERVVFTWSRPVNTCDAAEDRTIILSESTHVIFALHKDPIYWKPSDGGDPVLRKHTSKGELEIDFCGELEPEECARIDALVADPAYCETATTQAPADPVLFDEFDSGKYDHTVTAIDGMYTFYWSLSDDGLMLHFAVDVATRGWVGLGFSPTGDMPKSDIAFAFLAGDGTPFITDRIVGEDAGRPRVDVRQDLQLLAAMRQPAIEPPTSAPAVSTTPAAPVAKTVFTWSRDINTCDPNKEDHKIDIRNPTFCLFASHSERIEMKEGEAVIKKHDFKARDIVDFGRDLTTAEKDAAWATTEAASWCENYQVPEAETPVFFDSFNATEYTYSVEVSASYTLYWKRSHNNTRVQLAIESTAEGWVGLGVALVGDDEMNDVDIALGYVDADGVPSFVDRYAEANGRPHADKQNDVRDVRGLRPAWMGPQTTPGPTRVPEKGWKTRNTVVVATVAVLLLLMGCWSNSHSSSDETDVETGTSRLDASSSLLKANVQGGMRSQANV